MENYRYEEVNRNSRDVDNGEFKWKPFLRQVFVCSGVWANLYLFGLLFGAPAVIIPQLRQEANSTAAVSEEMSTWLSSTFSISAIGWLFLLVYIAATYGRRISFLVVSASSLIGFTVFYCSVNTVQILIAEVMLGAPRAAMVTISIMVVTEYTSPQNRGIMLTIKSASFYWGIFSANTIGTFTHWKNIGILGMVCSIYCMTALWWPESPQWLASKGEFEKSARSHRWLRGCNATSEAELKTLVSSQKQHLEASDIKETKQAYLQMIVRSVKCKDFYKPFLVSLLIALLFEFSGKMNSTMYSIVMIKKMTNSTSAAYSGMLILDGLTVFSTYIGCALAKFLKRRTLYLSASFIGIIFMLVISLQLYLIKLNVISESNVLSILLLSGYTITLACGPLILSASIVGEIAPSRFKSFFLLIMSLVTQLTLFLFLKMSPAIFRVLGMHGTFLLYALPSLFFFSLLYKHLPETRNKTFYEIEESFR